MSDVFFHLDPPGGIVQKTGIEQFIQKNRMFGQEGDNHRASLGQAHQKLDAPGVFQQHRQVHGACFNGTDQVEDSAQRLFRLFSRTGRF